MFHRWIGLSSLRFAESEDDRWSPSKKRSDSHEAIAETLVGRGVCAAAQRPQRFGFHPAGDLQKALDFEGRTRCDRVLAEVLAVVHGLRPCSYRPYLETLSS